MSRLRKLLFMEEHTCPWWFGYTFDNPLRPLVHPPEHVLGGLVQEGETVADIGCGGGHFTLGLAGLVGTGGRVVAVDLQKKMLARARARAERLGLDGAIDFRPCEQDHLGLKETLDFVLAFWMVHEVSDQKRFFSEILLALKPSGRLLVAEPKVHVTASRFQSTLGVARESGFTVSSRPRVRFSRAVILSPISSLNAPAA